MPYCRALDLTKPNSSVFLPSSAALDMQSSRIVTSRVRWGMFNIYTTRLLLLALIHPVRYFVGACEVKRDCCVNDDMWEYKLRNNACVEIRASITHVKSTRFSILVRRSKLLRDQTPQFMTEQYLLILSNT